MEKTQLKPLLEGDRILIRKHDLSLASTMYEYVDKDRERLDRFLPWVEFIKSAYDEESYIKLTHQRWEEGTHFDFGIFEKEKNEYMGNIGVHSIRWSDSRAELGYWILGEFEGKGYMSEAVLLLEKHLFEIGFHRVQIRCSDLNARSSEVPKRCGYHFEGTARHDAFEKGKFRNTMTFSKLSTD